jgi:membrane-associated protease RseP (regulator of RpoE activity)
MLFALGVAVFILGLLVSISLHELGHLTFAKRFGVKVTQYMVGFGPTVWSRRRGETEYGIKAIPMGGYIRMIGMVPPAKPTTRWPRRMAELVEDFRKTSRDEVLPGDEDRQFYRLPVRRRVLVMFGGPVVNLAIYIVLMGVVLCGIGAEQLTNRVAGVAACIVPASSSAASAGACPDDARPAPAAGVLQAGDRILAIDGVATTSWSDTVSVIERSAGVPLSVTIERDGRRQDVQITPVANQKYASDTGTATVTVGMIGVTSTLEFVRTPIYRLPGDIASQLGDGATRLAALPARVWDLMGTVFEGKPRDPNGAVGVVGLGRLGGEIASTHQFDMMEKVQFLLSLIASLNLLLFLFNMVPLLPLDGGHIAGAVYEGLRRKIARARSRPDPGSVDTAAMLPVIYGVASLMVAVSVLVLYADIVSPVNLFSG